MRQLLEVPVLVGDVLLAPTTELAGLAELASLGADGDTLDVLSRIARAIRSEDAERDDIARLRASLHPAALPRRR